MCEAEVPPPLSPCPRAARLVFFHLGLLTFVLHRLSRARLTCVCSLVTLCQEETGKFLLYLQHFWLYITFWLDQHDAYYIYNVLVRLDGYIHRHTRLIISRRYTEKCYYTIQESKMCAISILYMHVCKSYIGRSILGKYSHIALGWACLFIRGFIA